MSFLAFLPYPFYKLLIVALLALNVPVFARYGTIANTLDALVWFALLVLYELQNLVGLPVLSTRRLQHIRHLLIAIVIGVFLRYLQTSEWLEVVNDLLWFALIALLETEVRWPDRVRQYRQCFWVATLLIFSGLIGIVAVWAWQSAWLDVYDACLWIIAFGSIEADIFRLLQCRPD